MMRGDVLVHVENNADIVLLEVVDDSLDVVEVLHVVVSLPGLHPGPHGAQPDHPQSPGREVPGVARLQQSLVVPGRFLPDKVYPVIDTESSPAVGRYSLGEDRTSLTPRPSCDLLPQHSVWTPPSGRNLPRSEEIQVSHKVTLSQPRQRLPGRGNNM